MLQLLSNTDCLLLHSPILSPTHEHDDEKEEKEISDQLISVVTFESVAISEPFEQVNDPTFNVSIDANNDNDNDNDNDNTDNVDNSVDKDEIDYFSEDESMDEFMKVMEEDVLVDAEEIQRRNNNPRLDNLIAKNKKRREMKMRKEERKKKASPSTWSAQQLRSK